MSKAWMPLYVGDFLADTMHLSATERGIYISLIIHCWQHGSIPRDRRKLTRIAACSPQLWHQHAETVLQFFDVVNDVTMEHRRVKTELLRYEEKRNQTRDAALRMHARKHANAEQTHMQSQSQSSSKTVIVKTQSLGKAASRSGSNGPRAAAATIGERLGGYVWDGSKWAEDEDFGTPR